MLHFHNILMSGMHATPHFDFISFNLFESTVASNNHTCEVIDGSDNFLWTLTLSILLLLCHMGGGYLAAYHMREEDIITLPLQAITIQAFMPIETTLP